MSEVLEKARAFETRYSPVDRSNFQYGQMWECPDFFPWTAKQVLLVSPVEMSPIGLEFHAGHGTVCIVGSYHRETNQFTRQEASAISFDAVGSVLLDVEKYDIHFT